MVPPRQTPAVLAVSSHVVRGGVGNRAAAFALETLGYPVWTLPTVVLPWHPGHGPATRLLPDPTIFEAMIGDLCRAPWLGEVAGVFSGYLGEASQADGVARVVEAVRERNPGAPYLCDPVIGDADGLYVPEPVAVAIRDRLLAMATITTPNRFELAWLMDAQPRGNGEIVAAARRSGVEKVLVTSAHASAPGTTGNLLVTGDTALLAEHPRLPRPPSGTGDLVAALFLARLLAGRSDGEALVAASASVFEIVARTLERGGDELALAAEAASLRNPSCDVRARRLEQASTGPAAIRPS